MILGIILVIIHVSKVQKIHCLAAGCMPNEHIQLSTMMNSCIFQSAQHHSVNQTITKTHILKSLQGAHGWKSVWYQSVNLAANRTITKLLSSAQL